MPFYSLAQLRRYERLANEGADGATHEKLDDGLLGTDIANIPARKGPPKPSAADAEPQESDEDFRSRMVSRKISVIAARQEAANIKAHQEANPDA